MTYWRHGGAARRYAVVRACAGVMLMVVAAAWGSSVLVYDFAFIPITAHAGVGIMHVGGRVDVLLYQYETPHGVPRYIESEPVGLNHSHDGTRLFRMPAAYRESGYGFIFHGVSIPHWSIVTAIIATWAMARWWWRHALHVAWLRDQGLASQQADTPCD